MTSTRTVRNLIRTFFFGVAHRQRPPFCILFSRWKIIVDEWHANVIRVARAKVTDELRIEMNGRAQCFIRFSPLHFNFLLFIFTYLHYVRVCVCLFLRCFFAPFCCCSENTFANQCAMKSWFQNYQEWNHSTSFIQFASVHCVRSNRKNADWNESQSMRWPNAKKQFSIQPEINEK